MTDFPIGNTQYNVIDLLGMDPRKCWGLFDGKSSSERCHQFVMAVDFNQKLDFLTQDIETGECSIDFGLDGDIIAVINQDTEKFECWTPTATLIVSAPILLETLREIASGEAPHNPRVLAQAALQHIERILNHGTTS